MSPTWTAEREPDPLPRAPLPARIGGGIRLVGFVSLTLLALVIFLIGLFLRKRLGRWVQFHFLAARLWGRISCRLFGLRPRVTGRPIRAGALVANHSSWSDIIVLRALKLMYFVSKSDVAAWPGIGFVARVTGTVFIERKRTEAKRQEQMLRERIAADQLLCFFPEGTSTDGLRVLPFKSSLFSAFFADSSGADLLVQPVSIRYRPEPGLPANFYGWWGAMGFESHIWALLTRSRGGVVEVTFHAAVSPRAFRDRKAMAEYCETVVRAGFEGRPTPEPPLLP